MATQPDDPSGRTPDSLPEGAGDSGQAIAEDGRSLKGEGDSGRLQGDEAVQEDEFGDGI